jgi:uncharacterized protein (DUF983 family)
MLFPWSKPPGAITCPVCGAKVSVRWDKNRYLQPKPHCGICGWNVGRARTQLLAQVRQTITIAGLFAVYAWAITGMKWSIPFAFGWVVIFMAFPIIRQLRRLPPTRPVRRLEPLEGIADLRTITLDTTTPRLGIIIEGLIVIVSALAILFLPRELNPARPAVPKLPHQLLFAMLTTAFAAYQFVIHGVLFFLLVRSIWLERHLAKRAMTMRGRITDSTSGRIKYEFLDHANQLVRGSGRDYALGLYEDMPLSVLYDPDAPSLNMPVAGLQFHRPRV